MSIMQQSSKAQDRTLGVWFHQIDQGSVKLPRFQRFEAWDRGRITSFLNTIISNLPVGVTLVLEVAGPEKFVSRYISSAERTTGTVTQNLLDGQQRLTAFWRAMHNNYEGETFFVYLPQFDHSDEVLGGEVEVRCVPRWINKNKLRMPRWAEEPFRCFERRLIPIALLRPGELATDIDSWLSAATKPLEPAEADHDAFKKYKAYSALKDKIKNEHCPSAGHYGDLSDLILSTSALLQDKTPNARGKIEMDKAVMLKNWARLERGLDRMARLLASQGVYDEARLPTNAVLPVIAACYDLIPENGDFLGKGEKLLRQYLWSSFFTDRYENTASSRAYADFKALKALLLKQSYSDDELATVPVLNRAEFALADVDSLLGTGWPKQVGIGARGILAVMTYLGALDFADNKPASFESNQKREYHHIFPTALLADANIGSYLALNCAFITWKTNRIIGRKDPLEYLLDRVEWAGEESVRERMKSHLIDFDLLASASYKGLEGEQLAAKLKLDFETFLRVRAKLVHTAVTELAQGKPVTVGSLQVMSSVTDSA